MIKPKFLKRDLSDTPFASKRLIIWTLGISSYTSLLFIGVLAYQRKDIPPSLTMAFGITTATFINKLEKGK